MGTVLDMQVMGGYGFQPTSDKKEQASHAADPKSFGPSAMQIVIALLVLYALIYGLHVTERWMRRG